MAEARKLINKFKKNNDERDFYASFIKNLIDLGYTDWAIGEYLAKIINVMEGDYA